MSGLPTGWAETVIAEVGEVFLGITPAKNQYVSDGSYKVIKFRDIKEGRLIFTNNKDGFVTNEAVLSGRLKELKIGDVLITSAAHSGENIGKKCAFVSNIPSDFDNIFFTGELLNIRCNNDIINRWVYLFFHSAEGFIQIQNAVSGVHLTSGRAREMVVPFAPLNEQRRIVAKLEEVLTKVDASQQRLAKVPVILKRFRQAVLAAACSGRLTADWREENKVDEWEWSTLSKQDVSVQTGPFGSALHKHDYVSNGVPLINPMHIREGQLFPNVDQSVSEDKMKELTRYVLRPGDIVLGRRGEMGRAAVVHVPGLMCGTGSLILRATSKKVVPDFLCLLLRSPYTCAFLEEGSVGSTMTNLNQQVVGSLEFPIVSPDEQQEIVHRVESFFTLADQLEARYRTAKTHVDKLTQSILAKAFRGELVPQDPNDEPAAVLLERIRRQRETTPHVSKKKVPQKKITAKGSP